MSNDSTPNMNKNPMQEMHVICLCACSFDHPDQHEICESNKPAAVVDLDRPTLFQYRVPMCEPCARAHGAPILTNEEDNG